MNLYLREEVFEEVRKSGINELFCYFLSLRGQRCTVVSLAAVNQSSDRESQPSKVLPILQWMDQSANLSQNNSSEQNLIQPSEDRNVTK